MGVAASTAGALGSIFVLARCGRVWTTFSLLCFANVVAVVLTIGHVAFLLDLVVTIECAPVSLSREPDYTIANRIPRLSLLSLLLTCSEWCCELEDSDPANVRSLLIGIVIWFTLTAILRMATLGPGGALAARKAPLRATVIPMGHPVPPDQAQVVVGVPVQAQQVISAN